MWYWIETYDVDFSRAKMIMRYWLESHIGHIIEVEPVRGHFVTGKLKAFDFLRTGSIVFLWVNIDRRYKRKKRCTEA